MALSAIDTAGVFKKIGSLASQLAYEIMGIPRLTNDGLAATHGDRQAPQNGMWSALAADDPFYSQQNLDFYLSQYDAEIRFNDDSLGALFDCMPEHGLWENTLVIFTSDHGEGFGEHNEVYFHHNDPYEHTSHVPLVMRHPALGSGMRIERAVSLVDIAPTVLDLLGLPPNPRAQGESLAPLILDNVAPERPFHFIVGRYRRGYQTHSVRSDTHKLILDVDEHWLPFDAVVERLARLWIPEGTYNAYRYRRIERELYDLETDPEERRNLAAEGSPVIDELEGELWAWMESTYYEGRNRDGLDIEQDPEALDALRALGYIVD